MRSVQKWRSLLSGSIMRVRSSMTRSERLSEQKGKTDPTVILYDLACESVLRSLNKLADSDPRLTSF